MGCTRGCLLRPRFSCKGLVGFGIQPPRYAAMQMCVYFVLPDITAPYKQARDPSPYLLERPLNYRGPGLLKVVYDGVIVGS